MLLRSKSSRSVKGPADQVAGTVGGPELPTGLAVALLGGMGRRRREGKTETDCLGVRIESQACVQVSGPPSRYGRSSTQVAGEHSRLSRSHASNSLRPTSIGEPRPRSSCPRSGTTLKSSRSVVWKLMPHQIFHWQKVKQEQAASTNTRQHCCSWREKGERSPGE